MLEDRGYSYLGTNYEKIKMDKDKIENNVNIKSFEISDYTHIFNNFKYHLLFKKRKSNNYVIIFFLDSFLKNDDDLNNAMKHYYKYVNIYFKNIFDKIEHIYLACSEKYSPTIKKKIIKDNFFTETLEYKLYNPTKNKYFSKHEKIKNYEQKYKKFNLKLPIILKNDVASVWYDYKINDIVKIERNDKSIYYRIVTNEENYLH